MVGLVQTIHRPRVASRRRTTSIGPMALPKRARTPLWLVAPLSLASLAVWPAPVAAECVSAPRSAAGQLAHYAIAFVGDVTEVVNTGAPGLFGIYQVTFSVLEAYKGSHVGIRTMRFTLSAEGFGFEKGQRVLVLTRRVSRAERLRDPAPPEFRAQYDIHCTATRKVDLDDPDLQEFRRRTSRRR
jgi:hypothetical protein